MAILSQHYPGAVTHNWSEECTRTQVTCANEDNLGPASGCTVLEAHVAQPDKRHFLHWRTMEETWLICACQDYSGKWTDHDKISVLVTLLLVTKIKTFQNINII